MPTATAQDPKWCAQFLDGKVLPKGKGKAGGSRSASPSSSSPKKPKNLAEPLPSLVVEAPSPNHPSSSPPKGDGPSSEPMFLDPAAKRKAANAKKKPAEKSLSPPSSPPSAPIATGRSTSGKVDTGRPPSPKGSAASPGLRAQKFSPPSPSARGQKGSPMIPPATLPPGSATVSGGGAGGMGAAGGGGRRRGSVGVRGDNVSPRRASTACPETAMVSPVVLQTRTLTELMDVLGKLADQTAIIPAEAEVLTPEDEVLCRKAFGELVTMAVAHQLGPAPTTSAISSRRDGPSASTSPAPTPKAASGANRDGRSSPRRAPPTARRGSKAGEGDGSVTTRGSRPPSGAAGGVQATNTITSIAQAVMAIMEHPSSPIRPLNLLAENTFADDETFMYAFTSGRPRWQRLKSRFGITSFGEAKKGISLKSFENMDMFPRMEIIQSLLEKVCGEGDYDPALVQELVFMEYEPHRPVLVTFKNRVLKIKARSARLLRRKNAIISNLFRLLGAPSSEASLPFATVRWFALRFYHDAETVIREEFSHPSSSETTSGAVNFATFAKLISRLEVHHESESDQMFTDFVYRSWLSLGGDAPKAGVLDREVVCSNAYRLGVKPNVIAHLDRQRWISGLTYAMFHNVLSNGFLEPPDDDRPEPEISGAALWTLSERELFPLGTTSASGGLKAASGGPNRRPPSGAPSARVGAPGFLKPLQSTRSNRPSSAASNTSARAGEGGGTTLAIPGSPNTSSSDLVMMDASSPHTPTSLADIAIAKAIATGWSSMAGVGGHSGGGASGATFSMLGNAIPEMLLNSARMGREQNPMLSSLSNILTKHGKTVGTMRHGTTRIRATEYMVHSRVFLRPLHMPECRADHRMRGWKGVYGPNTDPPKNPDFDEEHFLRKYMLHRISARSRSPSQYAQSSYSPSRSSSQSPL